jgi:hypothetical protein
VRAKIGKVFVMIRGNFSVIIKEHNNKNLQNVGFPLAGRLFFVHISPLFGKNTITYIGGE